jgi:hypothetical protein
LQSPQQAVDELLAADRAFSGASAKATDVIAGLAPMFADDVAMPIPGGRLFTATKAEAIEAMRANPDNLKGRAEWTPIRGGISADGQHGFTAGYMTVRRADNSEALLKYLAYWIKTPAGWRVAVYRRRPRGQGAVSSALMPPSLPAGMTAAQTDSAVIEAARASLAKAEAAFSAEAQSIGLAAAFTKWGRADAMNIGPPDAAGFIVGAEAIGRSVGAGTPATSSPVVWAPDHRVIVASSGDLGVTLGTIRPNDGKNPPIPFFTIWRRDGPSGVWRYIAE